MRWTTERPAKPGFYWYKRPGDEDEVVNVALYSPVCRDGSTSSLPIEIMGSDEIFSFDELEDDGNCPVLWSDTPIPEPEA